MAFNLFQGVETKKKKRTTSTPVSTSKSGFNLFAPRQSVQTEEKQPETKPKEQIKPRGEELPQRHNLKNPRKLANGNIVYDKPSGGTLEYRPDGSFISRLPAYLGGGAYEAKADGGLIGTAKERQDKRGYAGVPSLTGNQRDHIIPVSLGGVSDTRTNIRRVPEAQNPADLEEQLAKDVASGKKTIGQARVEIMTYKQNQHMNVPKTDLKSNFLDSISGAVKQTAKNLIPAQIKDTKRTFDLFKKPEQGQTFKIGENLTEQQKRTANLTLDRSSGIAQNEAFDRSGKADQMNLGKTVKDLVRATPRGIVQITQPTNELEPLEQKYPKLFRFVYGDEKLVGYSRQAADTETQLREKGFGKLSTPLAVLQSTGTAAMDLAPLYAPALRSINEEIASVAKNLGKKEIKLTYKDLQDITSGKLTSGEKFDAFKTVAKDIDIKKALKEGGLDITKQEDTLLARMANNPITKLGEKAPTTYSVPENSIAAVKPKEFSVKQLEGKVQEAPQKPKIASQKAETPKVVDSTPKTYYHGTTKENATNIIKSGFKVEKSTNGAILGEGVYLDKTGGKGAKLYGDEIIETNIPSNLKLYKGDPVSLSIKETNYGEPAKITEYLKSKGYDGVEGVNQVVIFDPNQIKTIPKETGTKVAKTASDINKELVSKGFDSLPDEVLAKYTPDTKKRVMAEVDEIMNDLPKARAIISGAEDAPSNVKQVLFNSMEAYARKNNDIKLFQELASSPIASELSGAAQALGASGFNKDPNSVVQVMRQIQKMKEAKAIKKAGSDRMYQEKKKRVVSAIKKEVERVNLSKKDLEWEAFISEITC